MGSLFSRNNRVDPLHCNQEVELERKESRKKWLRCCWCCNNKVVAINSCSSNHFEREKSIVFSKDDSFISVIEAAEDNWSSRESLEQDYMLLKSPLFCGKLELQGEKKPLPKIKACNNTEKFGANMIRKDQLGNTTSVSFAVDLNGLPMAYTNVRSSFVGPRHLPKLPRITQRIVQARLIEATGNEQMFETSKPAKVRRPPTLSRKMLERLEAEKQRELVLQRKEKEKDSSERRQRLMQRNEEKIETARRKREIVKQNKIIQSRNASLVAQDNLTSKMRKIENRKTALRLKAEEKKEVARIRRLRASIRFRASKRERSTILDGEVLSENTETRIREIQRRLRLQTLDEDDICNKIASVVESCNEGVCDEEELNEMETFQDHDDSAVVNFGEENSSGDDSFWDIA